MLDDHVRSGLDALDDEGAHHQRHDGVFGDADAHQRDEAGARGGLVGGSLAGHAFNGAVADFVLVFAELLVQRVGGELGDGGAAAGQDAQEGADHAAAQRAGDDALELGPGRDQLDLAVERRVLRFGIQVLDDFGDAEGAQGDADQADAIRQRGEIHGVALHAAVDVGADLPKQHTDHAGGHAVEQAAGGHEADAEEAEYHQRAVVLRAEFQGNLAQRGRQPGQHHDRHRAADEAGDARREQSQAGLPLERHRIAVDTGHDTAGVGDLHGDRADAVTVLGAVVDAGQHDQRAAGVHRVGQRQQQADGGQRPQTRQQTDDGADRATDGAIHQVAPGQGMLEAKR